MHRVTIGSLMVGLGVIHNAVGVVLGWPHLQAILADGYVGAVPDDAPFRMAIFWFLWFGWMAMLLGASMHWAERRGLLLPRGLGVGLAALGLTGALAMPASGFWLVVALGGLVWWRSNGPAPAPAG